MERPNHPVRDPPRQRNQDQDNPPLPRMVERVDVLKISGTSPSADESKGNENGASDDPFLVERARKGSRSAFDELVKRHQAQVYRLAFRFFYDPEEAMDATQEVFLKAYRALPGFEGRSSFKTWLFRITSNACMNLSQAKARRKKSLMQSVLDWFSRVPPTDPSAVVVENESREELQKAVQQKIARLPEVYRVPVILRDIEGMSLDRIGHILEIPDGTVKSRINRGRRLLQDSLEGFFLRRNDL